VLGHDGAVADDVEQPGEDQPQLGPFPEVLDLEQAAAFLGAKVRTLAQMARDGEVPAKKVGREWRFSRPGLHDWLSGRLKARAEQPES